MANLGEFGAAVRDASESREPDVFTFYGEQIKVADAVGAMPLLRFAAIADSGVDAEEMAGLAAMYELLRDCIDNEDWPRFQRLAADNKVPADTLMEVCRTVYEAITGRPTNRPSESADGSLTTTGNLRVVSSSEASSYPLMERDRRMVDGLRPIEQVGTEILTEAL
jgi:hypothetical protein